MLPPYGPMMWIVSLSLFLVLATFTALTVILLLAAFSRAEPAEPISSIKPRADALTETEEERYRGTADRHPKAA